MRRWKAFATATVLVATLGTAHSAFAQSSSEEGRFVDLINQLRASKGVPALTIDGGLASTSCGWTDHMVAVATLAHDPNLASEVSSVEASWTKAGKTSVSAETSTVSSKRSSTAPPTTGTWSIPRSTRSACA